MTKLGVSERGSFIGACGSELIAVVFWLFFCTCWWVWSEIWLSFLSPIPGRAEPLLRNNTRQNDFKLSPLHNLNFISSLMHYRAKKQWEHSSGMCVYWAQNDMFTEIAVAAGLPSGRELSLTTPVWDPGVALLRGLWHQGLPPCQEGPVGKSSGGTGQNWGSASSSDTFLVAPTSPGGKGKRRGISRHSFLERACVRGEGAKPRISGRVSALLWEWEKCLGQRTGAGAMWLKTPSPKDGQRWWLGSGRAAPGYSSPGGMCHRRKGDIVCGYSKENTTPDGRDEVGMLQMPQTKSAREGRKGS